MNHKTGGGATGRSSSSQTTLLRAAELFHRRWNGGVFFLYFLLILFCFLSPAQKPTEPLIRRGSVLDVCSRGRCLAFLSRPRKYRPPREPVRFAFQWKIGPPSTLTSFGNHLTFPQSRDEDKPRVELKKKNRSVL